MVTVVPYETDMAILYDVVTKCAFVAFRGKSDLLGPFTDKATATAAAEEYCRIRGWNG